MTQPRRPQSPPGRPAQVRPPAAKRPRPDAARESSAASGKARPAPPRQPQPGHPAKGTTASGNTAPRKTQAGRPAPVTTASGNAVAGGTPWAPVSKNGRARAREDGTRTSGARRPDKAPQQRRSGVALAEPTAIDLVIERARARVTESFTLRHDAREKERRKARRRLWMSVWGKRLGLLAAVAVLGWLALLSPVFALDPAKVEVSGYGTVVDPLAVRDAIGEFEGTALAVLNTGRVSHELKEILGVREAHVERSWPAGLVVTIESREPVAAIPERAGGWAYVDDDGVQVGRTDDKPTDLPVLTVPRGEDNARVLASALGVLHAMPEGLRERVALLDAATEDSVNFTLRKGPKVEWGSADQSELKVAVLQVLLESKEARSAKVIDVSAPTLPITKD